MNLDGWVIAIAHGRTFIGRPDKVEDPSELSPVFSLQSDAFLVQGPRGEAGMTAPCYASPALGFPSLNRIDLPVDIIVIPVDSLGDADRKKLEHAIKIGLDMAHQLRAAESGLITPGRVDDNALSLIRGGK